MAGIIDVLPNLNVGGILSSVGDMAKKIREAITGKEVVDPNKATEIVLLTQQIESAVQQGTIAVVVAETQSQDKWTSRGRPSFLYVMYVYLLLGIPLGVLAIFHPDAVIQFASGVGTWLKAIPESMWYLFGAGYLGYGAFRSWDKKNGRRD